MTPSSMPRGTAPDAETDAGPITLRFHQRTAQGRAALVPYICAGFPDEERTRAMLDAAVESGADVVEVGIPFSDPLADGPTIQRASFRALEGGTTPARALELVADFRSRHDVPVVVFTYLNPVLRMGPERFLREAKEAGAHGILLTDLPAGGDRELEDRILEGGLDPIRLVAPTTLPDRRRAILRNARGFVYYISRTGVTGARPELRAELGREVEALRADTDLPVAVGFGVSTPAQAGEVAEVADGVVVGSAVVQALEEGGVEAAAELLASFRAAMDAVVRPGA